MIRQTIISFSDWRKNPGLLVFAVSKVFANSLLDWPTGRRSPVQFPVSWQFRQLSYSSGYKTPASALLSASFERPGFRTLPGDDPLKPRQRTEERIYKPPMGQCGIDGIMLLLQQIQVGDISQSLHPLTDLLRIRLRVSLVIPK